MSTGENMTPTIVMIVDKAKTKCLGTGFYIGDKNHVITCWHCVKGNYSVGDTVVFFNGRKCMSGNLVRVERDEDIALIKTSESGGKCVTNIKRMISQRENHFKVEAYGFNQTYGPDDYLVLDLDTEYVSHNQKRITLKDANDIVVGFSGGPVFRYDSGIKLLIGMIRRYDDPEYTRGHGTGYSYAISIESILNFIKGYDSAENTNLRKQLINHPNYKERWFEPLFLNPKDDSKTCQNLFINPDLVWMQYDELENEWVERKKNGSKFITFPDKYDELEKNDKALENNYKELFELRGQDDRMLVLLGSPGSGKSTFSLWLYHHGLKDPKDDNVILWRFKDFKKVVWNPKNPNMVSIYEDIINEIFPGYDTPEVKKNNLKDKVLILDGLDEVQISLYEREELINHLKEQLVDEVENSRVIITCRTNGLKVNYDASYGYGNGKCNIDCTVAELAPLSDEQIRSFADKYGYDLSRIKGLFQTSSTGDEKKSLRNVLGVPLIFYMVMALNLEIDGNASRGELYDRIFSFGGGIYKRASSYDIDTHAMLKNENNIRFLHRLSQDIAYWMFLNPNSGADDYTISMDKAKEILEYIKQEGEFTLALPDEYEGNLTDLLMNSYFAINHTENDAVSLSFVHKSMMEYFAAGRISYEIYKLFQLISGPHDNRCNLEQLGLLLSQRLLTDEIKEYLEDILTRQYSDQSIPAGRNKVNYPIGNMHQMSALEDKFNDALFHKLGYYNDTEDPLKCERIWDCVLEREEIAFRNYLSVFHMMDRITLKHPRRKGRHLFEWNADNIHRMFPEYIKLVFGKKGNGSLDLSRLDIIGFSLERLDLSGVDFRNSRIINSNFDFANLEEADFTGTEISYTSFQHALMTNVVGFDYDYYDKNKEMFKGADFAGVSLSKANNSYPAIGSLIKFGRYYQSNDREKEPIWWRVLDIQDGRALLLADKALDVQPYHTKFEEIDWEHCTLNRWLNTDFKNEAFNREEWERVCELPEGNTRTLLKNEGCKLFLLSKEEVKKYFLRSKDEMAEAKRWYNLNGRQAIAQGTPYVIRKIGGTSSDTCVWWWLRSPCNFYVNIVNGGGDFVSNNVINDGSVRPAFYLNLKSPINL